MQGSRSGRLGKFACAFEWVSYEEGMGHVWPFLATGDPQDPLVTSAGLFIRFGCNIDVLCTSKSVGNSLLAVFGKYFGT